MLPSPLFVVLSTCTVNHYGGYAGVVPLLLIVTSTIRYVSPAVAVAMFLVFKKTYMRCLDYWYKIKCTLQEFQYTTLKLWNLILMMTK